MSGPEYSSLPATDIDNISGDIFVPSVEADTNTLDEPVSATLVSCLNSPTDDYKGALNQVFSSLSKQIYDCFSF